MLGQTLRLQDHLENRNTLGVFRQFSFLQHISFSSNNRLYLRRFVPKTYWLYREDHGQLALCPSREMSTGVWRRSSPLPARACDMYMHQRRLSNLSFVVLREISQGQLCHVRVDVDLHLKYLLNTIFRSKRPAFIIAAQACCTSCLLLGMLRRTESDIIQINVGNCTSLEEF